MTVFFHNERIRSCYNPSTELLIYNTLYPTDTPLAVSRTTS